jgi:lipopolysaccharide transport system permease protein
LSQYHPTLLTGLRGLVAHRALLYSLARRDVETRYRGTALGFVWAVLQPLMMLAVYAFVFGGIFKSRWTPQGGIQDFVQMLYCGLIVHGVFSDTLSRSPGAVLSNPGYVKKVVFPLELLPLCQLASAVFNAAVSLVLVSLLVLIQHHSLPVTALLVPVILTPLFLLTAGLGWLLAAVGVFFRDVGQVINIAMSVLLFLSPVFYPASAAAPFARQLIYLNPLTYPMEALRSVLVLGVQPNWLHWLAYSAIGAISCLAGLWFFQRTRPAFADVI